MSRISRHYPTSSPESRIPSPESRNPNPESRVPNPESRVSSPESRVPSPVVVHLGYNLPRRGLPATASFRRWVAAALDGAGRGDATELSIVLVDAGEGRELNHQYRDKDYATNVLSFPVELPEGVETPLIGDLVICAPVVAREAAEQGKPERNHWAHMTVHGVLHLLGHDHIVDSEAEHMEALETRILATLDIPDPYTLRT